jgi:hypothetical protein
MFRAPALEELMGAGRDSISIIRERHRVVKGKTIEKARFSELFLHGYR